MRSYKMKRIFSILLFLSFSLFIASCSSDDNPTGNDDPSSFQLGTMKATINGSSWQSNQAQGTLAGISIIISGASLEGNSITITFPETEPGTYSNAYASYNQVNMSNPYDQKVYSAAKANYTIDSYDGEVISGTFSFTGELQNGDGTSEIKNGKFKVKIINN